MEARSAILSALPLLGGYRRIGEPLDHGVLVEAVAISPDSRTLAGATDAGTVWLWDVATRRRLGRPLPGHTGTVFDVAFSPDGTLLASAGEDGRVRLWNVRARRPSGRPLAVPTELVLKVEFSPDGTMLAAAGSPGRFGTNSSFRGLSTVRLWDVVTRRELRSPFTSRALAVYDIDFHPDGTVLAIAGTDTTVRLLDVATGRQLGRPLRGHRA